MLTSSTCSISVVSVDWVFSLFLSEGSGLDRKNVLNFLSTYLYFLGGGGEKNFISDFFKFKKLPN